VFSSRGTWPWQHYLGFADELTVASRMKELPADLLVDTLAEASRAGVRFVEVPSLSGPVIRFTHRREAAARLTETLHGADALVARLPSEIGTLAIEIATRLGKPWAVEVVTCTWDALWNYGTWQGKAYAPWSWWRTRAVVRRAPFALYVTRSFLQRRYPSHGRTVACSDVELVEPDKRALERRLAPAAPPDGPFRIGMIAALSVRFKGVQTALEAVSLVRERLPPFELRVVGVGDPKPWKEEARRLDVERQTVFEGVLPKERIPTWLDGIDLYLQPSFQEGLPRALLEAMSRACPALGSTAGGIPELLDSLCLHEPGDARALADLLVRAVGDLGWRRSQAARNFDEAQKYTGPTLDRIRKEFWNEFATFARRA
jgi:glycosyltransferase involved in cell wall biosynthesis